MSYSDSFNQSTGDRRICGVVVGVVLDNNDKGEQGRIKVKFPGLTGDKSGYWARIALLMAGAGRGTFFLPEIGDEVLVAFEEGDITRPYVLGALWNGKDKPPAANTDGKNNLRFIKSRSGHLVRFDDTSGAEKIEIIDKSSKNSIVIDTAGNKIVVKSSQDVSIEAPQGTIKLSAKNIEIVSTADTKVQAAGGLFLDGSPGNTNIKGSMVNIN